MGNNRGILVLVLLAVPLLVGGQCAFFFSSGGGSSDRDVDDDKKGLTIIASNGRLSGIPVHGARYESGSIVGVTGSRGEFSYEEGKPVRFSIGDIALGEPVPGRATLALPDLVSNGTAETPAVINMARLLQSLDADPQDEVITIPDTVRAKAVRSNEDLYWAIEYLDYTDEAAFSNAASQLVAVLTSDYAFAAALVDAQVARARLARAVSEAGQSGQQTTETAAASQ